MDNERRIKITVLKRAFNEELAQLYGVEELERCPEFEENEEYILEANQCMNCYQTLEKPEGFCEDAWQSIQKYVLALVYGSNDDKKFQFNDWIKIPGVAICSCSDGIRPVIFKVELEENTEEKEMQEDHEEIIDGNEEDDQDELVVTVFQDTKTVQLLDEFEGYTGDNSHKYKRMVLRIYNGNMYIYNSSYRYVVERGNEQTIYPIGGISFTDLKNGYDEDLRKYVESEITEDIIRKYENTNKFFKFSKPYLLRAQNRYNRIAYEESNEKRLFKRTTYYAITGVYLTSEYGDYIPGKRKKFYESEKEIEEIIVTELGEAYVYEIRLYSDRLNEEIKKTTQKKFMCLWDEDYEEIYLSAFIDSEKDIIYISKENYCRYNKFIRDWISIYSEWHIDSVSDRVIDEEKEEGNKIIEKSSDENNGNIEKDNKDDSERYERESEIKILEEHENRNNPEDESIEVIVRGYRNGIYKICPYTRSTNRTNDGKISFIVVNPENKGKGKLIQAFVHDDLNLIYAVKDMFLKYKNELKKEVFLIQNRKTYDADKKRADMYFVKSALKNVDKLSWKNDSYPAATYINGVRFQDKTYVSSYKDAQIVFKVLTSVYGKEVKYYANDYPVQKEWGSKLYKKIKESIKN